MYTYHKDGQIPLNGEIFVFGSNLAGIHGAGAAKEAYHRFKARFWVGEGPTGQSYAIPTKDMQIATRPIDEVAESIRKFQEYAASRPDLQFYITRVGCGLAGFLDKQIAPLFKGSTQNCIFPEEWRQYLEHQRDKADD